MSRRVIERSSGGTPMRIMGRAALVVVAVTVAVVISAVSLGGAASPPAVPSLSVDDPAPVVLADGTDEVTFTVTLTETAESPAALPETGSSTVPMLLVAVVLVVLGSALVVALRGSRSMPIVVVALVAGAITAAAPTAHAGPAPGDVTVSYHTEDGTATAPDDYAATSGTLTFGPGQVSAAVAVAVDAESDGGSFRLMLSDPVGATIAKSQGEATIVSTTTTTTTTVPVTSTAPPPTTAPPTTAPPTTTPPTTTPPTTTPPTTTPPTTTPPTTTPPTTTPPTTTPPVEGCVSVGTVSYRVPDGATIAYVTVPGSGEQVDVGYVELEGWSGTTCTGDQPRATTLYLTDDLALATTAEDELYPDNCRCGVRGEVTIDPFGTGWLSFLDR